MASQAEAVMELVEAEAEELESEVRVKRVVAVVEEAKLMAQEAA